MVSKVLMVGNPNYKVEDTSGNLTTLKGSNLAPFLLLSRTQIRTHATYKKKILAVSTITRQLSSALYWGNCPKHFCMLKNNNILPSPRPTPTIKNFCLAMTHLPVEITT